MKQKVLGMSVGLLLFAGALYAGNDVNLRPEGNRTDKQEHITNVEGAASETTPKKSRFTIGGYGEAAYSRNFYSDHYLRYKSPATYKDAKSHGRIDLPHVVIMLGYDFGKGWTMGSEIEFEHGGTESAIEIEESEGGEYESEIERGGEVALEQFWIQKSFCPAFNIKLGHIIVPVGATNAHHLPTEFFGVYRPEGENTIMPCTWHETGISLWGQTDKWRYEAMLLPGLDSDRFGRQGWIHDAAGSPYEFKIANAMAGAFRVDNYSVPGLRLSVSGYVGNSFSNSLMRSTSAKYEGVKGTVMIGAFDFNYHGHNWIVRGNVDYGHLTDSDIITTWNKNQQKSSPSKTQDVASDAIAIGLEAGYDVFSQFAKLREKEQKLYLFARYDYYDSMYKVETGVYQYDWCGRTRLAAGVNYCPMKEIVIKGEYSIGLLKSPYNNEPSISLGVAYAGLFNL